MYHWSVDTARLKQNPQEYEKFLLEQRINFGLNKHRLSLNKLKKHWNNLVIDPDKKRYLKAIVWPQS